MEKRYRVTLTDSERDDLRKLVRVGKAAAQKLVRARILLLADQAQGGSSKTDPEIVESLGCGRASVERVRKREHHHTRVTMFLVKSIECLSLERSQLPGQRHLFVCGWF